MAITQKAIEHFDRKVAGMYALLKDWSGQLEGYAKEHAPWNDQLSHARQGIHAGVEKEDDELRMYLAHGVEYGPLLEKGTPPHIIRPKNKKALFWKGAAHPVKQVNHPGTEPRAIIGPTMDAHISRIRKTVIDFWEGV